MQRESVLNRKGQEGLTLTTLLLIVLGVVVVVVLIIGFTNGFGFIFDKFGAAPGSQLQTIVKACEISGQNDLLVDYCARLNEVKSDTYVTCEDTAVKAAMDAKITQPTCSTDVRTSLVQACKDLNPDKNNVKINNKDIKSDADCDALKTTPVATTPPAAPATPPATTPVSP